MDVKPHNVLIQRPSRSRRQQQQQQQSCAPPGPVAPPPPPPPAAARARQQGGRGRDGDGDGHGRGDGGMDREAAGLAGDMEAVVSLVSVVPVCRHTLRVLMHRRHTPTAAAWLARTWRVLQGCCCACCSCHAQQHAHARARPQVARGYQAVLMDFGSARPMPIVVSSRAQALALQEDAEVRVHVRVCLGGGGTGRATMCCRAAVSACAAAWRRGTACARFQRLCAGAPAHQGLSH
jgi:hypothetical protein